MVIIIRHYLHTFIYIYIDFIGRYRKKPYKILHIHTLKLQATHVNAWRPQDSSTSETDDEEAEATETDETEEFAMEEDEKDLETADTGGEQ